MTPAPSSSPRAVPPLAASDVESDEQPRSDARGAGAAAEGSPRSWPLAAGYELSIGGRHADTLVLRAATGEVMVSILLTDAGPVLRFTGAAVDIRSAGTVAIDCARLELRAHEHVSIDSRGTLTQRSDRGMVLRSEDDVRVDGERILLNC